ncbi:hypothetical protein HW555_006413 [Spodoptera exigua]|uniref:Succinate dehydrogenase [ubiquinone] cytochrome b small subunit n=1 Tax=Spodoptera exigua TaxID=7107 RepID=A0A835GIP6_SPOEX|nr:hypothetical protein HW555_006413 [Spodoptera exigua]
MALSTLIRTPVFAGRFFSQQVLKYGSVSCMQRPLASMVPISQHAFKEVTQTPIINSVRSFRTSPVSLSGEKPHDHSKLWVIEKGVAALMVPLLPLGLLIPNKLFDSAIAILICAHSFWGLEAMVVEYVRVLLFGPFLPKVAMGVVYFVTVTMLGGLFYLIFNDIGLCRAFWRIWRNMRKPKGLEAIAIDYVRASVVGPILPKIALGLVYLISIAMLGGLFYIIGHDDGLANTIKQIWAIKSDRQKS